MASTRSKIAPIKYFFLFPYKDQVASVPLSRCSLVARSCGVCVALQDPYCAWRVREGQCVSLENSNVETLDSASFLQVYIIYIIILLYIHYFLLYSSQSHNGRSIDRTFLDHFRTHFLGNWWSFILARGHFFFSTRFILE